MVAAVMDGWEYIAEPGINAVLLVPSLVIWPAAHVFDHHSTKIICYPVGPTTSAPPEEPPLALLRAGQAVADERRLRIIRLLAREELTASEPQLAAGDRPDDRPPPPRHPARGRPAEREPHPAQGLPASSRRTVRLRGRVEELGWTRRRPLRLPDHC